MSKIPKFIFNIQDYYGEEFSVVVEKLMEAMIEHYNKYIVK